MGFPEHFVEPFSPIPGLCGATVYCAEGSKPTCLVYQPRKPAEESSFLSVSYIVVLAVACCCFVTSSVLVLGRHLLLFWDVLGLVPSLVRQPRKLAEDRLCFHLFLFSLSVACHCFGVLVVIVLGCCLSLFWGLVCCFGAASVVVVFKAL